MKQSMHCICFTVDAYWKYKFRNVSVPIEHDTELTELQVQWAANLSIASMYPKVAFHFQRNHWTQVELQRIDLDLIYHFHCFVYLL